MNGQYLLLSSLCKLDTNLSTALLKIKIPVKIAVLILVLGLTICVAQAEQDIQALSRSAAQGDAEAQVSLARKYLLGQGVLQDYAEAVKWFKKSAGRAVNSIFLDKATYR